MQIRAFKVILCFALASISGTAAAAFYCDGKVTTIGLNNGEGPLYVGYGTVGIQKVCHLATTFNGVDPATCRSWLAFLMAAQAQQRTVRFYYNPGDGGNPSSCEAFQSWYAYFPYFIQTLD